MYDLRDSILMVASDRISTYDVVHPTPIPDKGKVLTGLSVFWFQRTVDIVPNHYVSSTDGVPEEVRGRALNVRRLEMLPLECVVRGYLSGSGWKDYQPTGAVCGIELPAGLRESEQLPEPIFTPATKAEVGDHDENVPYEETARRIGAEWAATLRQSTLAVYSRARDIARERGLILADTKFEFGLRDGELVIGDEVLTPDSSRYWPADQWQPGSAQPSFDKQFIRDWLTSPASGWDRTSEQPPPELPAEVVERVRAKYVEAYERLTGTDWA
jgi:phosphoribosylaminoimidazole-succinocarboxamide synthase